MKKQKTLSVIAFLFLISGVVSAQEIWDDFSKGSFDALSLSSTTEKTIETEHASLPGGKRTYTVSVGANPYNQTYNLSNQDNLLISSSGYGLNSSIKIGYGGLNRNAMNRDLSAYKTLHISFKGKSNFARVYVNMWTNGANRGLWYGDGDIQQFHGSVAPNGSNRGKTIVIQLKDLKNKNGKFSIADVDALQIHLIGYEATGVNYALDKIWFE